MNDAQSDAPKAAILVVDDTRINLKVLNKIFTKNGYKVRLASNGVEALEAVRSELPDLIMLDVKMPEMNGYDVCAKLKKDKRTHDIPIIFLSALNETEDKIKAFSVGGVDFITKPFRSVELLARVETHLSLRSVQKGLESTLKELKETQSQLVESAKMAALGQLIAGVAHEINTPLGAIRASIGNISDALNESLTQLPQLFQRLSEAQRRQFFTLIERAGESQAHLSSREERKLRRKLRRELEEKEVDNADEIADTLVEIGIFEDVDEFIGAFREDDPTTVLNAAYNLIIQQKSGKNIEIAVDKASKVVFALKSYAHTDQTGECTMLDIVDGIEVVLTLYYSQIKHGVEVIKNYGDVPAILCHGDELNQVWTNLLHNALQAMEYKGRLRIDVLQEENDIVVSLTDSGGGVPPEIKDRIFDPFYTTKPAGEGSGLGLDIVRKIVEKHQGRIGLVSEPGETTFTVRLPIRTGDR